MAKRIKEKEKSKEQIFDELILKNWYLKEVYTYLLKYENEFVNLCDFVRNLDLSSHKIFMLLLPEGQQTIKSIIDERKNFEVFYAYKLNEFEFYLTKFIVAHCMFKYYKEDSKRTLFFNQVESITKGKANNFKYYIEYHRGFFCTGNNWGVCADWLLKVNVKKYKLIDLEELNIEIERRKLNKTNHSELTLKKIETIKLELNQTQIVYLFQTLIKEKLINETLNPKLWHLVSTYFTDKDNKPLSNIHQTKGNLENTKTGKPKAKADLIESIAKGIKKPS